MKLINEIEYKEMIYDLELSDSLIYLLLSSNKLDIYDLHTLELK
jgi:hypothetical protein